MRKELLELSQHWAGAVFCYNYSGFTAIIIRTIGSLKTNYENEMIILNQRHSFIELVTSTVPLRNSHVNFEIIWILKWIRSLII